MSGARIGGSNGVGPREAGEGGQGRPERDLTLASEHHMQVRCGGRSARAPADLEVGTGGTFSGRLCQRLTWGARDPVARRSRPRRHQTAGPHAHAGRETHEPAPAAALNHRPLRFVGGAQSARVIASSR